MILAWITLGVSLTFGTALIASLFIRNKNLFIFNRVQTVDAIFFSVCVFTLSSAFIWYTA